MGFITFGFKGANAAQLKALENKAAGAVRGTISNVSCLSQAILLKGYTAPEYAAQKKQKYEVLANRIRKIHADAESASRVCKELRSHAVQLRVFYVCEADRRRQ